MDIIKDQIKSEGYQAFHAKQWIHDCPYPVETDEASRWIIGFERACSGPSHD